MPWLINPAQLEKFRKNQKNVIVLDATWFGPSDTRNARDEFLQHHLPGARFLNLNELLDTETTLPNMLSRDEKLISEKISALGITNEHKLIFYDNSPYHTSCRALWMFKVFGHNPFLLYILDGGYEAWRRYKGKEETGEPRNVAAKSYNVTYQSQYIRTLLQMKSNLHHPTEQVVDVRHPVRYAGGLEIRPGLRSGHIPGSFNFPFTSFFETDGRFKPLEKIRKQLAGIGIELSLPIVTTCGSAITATILNFVLDLMNHPQHSVYDGSWSEWGAAALYPGETSLDERPVQTSLDETPAAC